MSAARTGPPIGLQLTRTSRAVSRAFDDALAAVGGSLPTWRVLLSLHGAPVANQRQLATAVGIQGATLTHHLNAMESAGLLTRRRDPANRRVHRVELTEQGSDAFDRMRAAAVAFDRRLRADLGTADIDNLLQLLARLHTNITSGSDSCAEPDTTGVART